MNAPRFLFLMLLMAIGSCPIRAQQGIPELIQIQQHTLVFHNQDSFELKSLKDPKKQLVVFLYHAEQDTIGLDPGLSVEGRWRAINLLNLWKEVAFKAYFTTPFRNNILTLQPLKDYKKVRLSYYDQADIQALAQSIEQAFPEPVIVMVHPETVGLIFEHLSGVSLPLEWQQYKPEILILLERNPSGLSSFRTVKYRTR